MKLKSVKVEDAEFCGDIKYKVPKTEDGNKKVQGRVLVTFDLGPRPELIAQLASLGSTMELVVNQIQTDSKENDQQSFE